MRFEVGVGVYWCFDFTKITAKHCCIRYLLNLTVPFGHLPSEKEFGPYRQLRSSPIGQHVLCQSRYCLPNQEEFTKATPLHCSLSRSSTLNPHAFSALDSRIVSGFSSQAVTAALRESGTHTLIPLTNNAAKLLGHKVIYIYTILPIQFVL